MPQIRVNAYIHAPREAVFALVTDHCRFLQGGGVARVRIAREGHSERDGLGCIREVRSRGVRLTEEVTVFERPARMDYQILECTLPIEHRGGSMLFIERADGTEIDWRSRFEVPLPLVGGPAGEFARMLFTDVFTQLLTVAKDALE